MLTNAPRNIEANAGRICSRVKKIKDTKRAVLDIMAAWEQGFVVANLLVIVQAFCEARDLVSGFTEPFRRKQPEPRPSRPEAVRRALADHLRAKGYLPARENPEGAN